MSSASRKMIDDCARYSISISAYVDGELDAAHAMDMEAHVVGCDACTERVALIRAVRQSLKRTAASRCPAALRARLHATIDAEKRRAVMAHEPGNDASNPKLMRLRYAVGLAAAAGVAFAMGMSSLAKARGDSQAVASARAASAPSDLFGIDALLDELLAMHAHPFKPDTINPEELTNFDPLLGVRVRRPAFQPFDARFQGARVHPVSDRGAYLQLQYAMPEAPARGGNKHLTVYIFNPRVVPMRATRLEPRVVRQKPVLVGRLRGYSVAALEQSGVGYAFASDFDTDESAKMALAAVEQ